MLHVDLHARCRRNTSASAHVSVGVHYEETKAIRALGWCPGPVVFRLQLYLLIFYKQPELIDQISVVSDCDFCMLPEISHVGPYVGPFRRAHYQTTCIYSPYFHFGAEQPFTLLTTLFIAMVGNTRLASGCAAWAQKDRVQVNPDRNHGPRPTAHRPTMVSAPHQYNPARDTDDEDEGEAPPAR